MTMENLPARTSGAGPLADYSIGMRVNTREGYPGVITDILEGPADLTTYWVTLDNGMGGGEYAEAEIWPLAAQQTASQMASEAGVERTAADDYPELDEILAERLPPSITTTAGGRQNDDLDFPITYPKPTPEEMAAEPDNSYNERWYGPSIWDRVKERFTRGTHEAAAMVHCTTCDVDYPIDSEGEKHDHSKQATSDEARDWNMPDSERDDETISATEAALKLALYLPPKPPSEQASSTTPLGPQEKQGYREGFEHGKEGLTRAPSLPLDPEFMAGYDLGWAEGVLVYRKPPDSEANTELEKAQIAGTFPDALGPMRAAAEPTMLDHLRQMEARGGIVDLGMPVVASEHDAGIITDFLKGRPNEYWKGIGQTYSYDWCRYRKDSHCWLSKDLNEEASKEAGYAVWNPVDRGFCPRIKWEDQIKCPVGAPGENVPGGLTNATVPWDEGGQHGGTPSGTYRESAKTIDATPPKPDHWEGPGIYEVDLSGVSTTGCVAAFDWVMGMAWPLAWLTWDKTKHTIEGVYVTDMYRGSGFGVHLLEQAAKVAGAPLVDSGEHTDLGYQWAKKRGLNPKRKIRTPVGDMARMTMQMNEALIGGHRIKRLLLPIGHKEAGLRVEATWADVRKKAKRIRETGGVRIVASRNDEVVGHIRGDHGIYETSVRRNPGRKNVAYWHCGCKWAAYSWGRSPAYKRFEGRMCSHALALQYEAQSRNMFGREMTLDEKQPAWMDQKHIHHPGDYRRDLKRYTMRFEAAQAVCPICGDVMLSNVAGMQCMMCGTSIPYVSTEGLEVISDDGLLEAERARFSLLADKATEFFARVRGVIRKVLLDDDGPKVDGKEVVSPREVLAPNWHPTKGLNVNDNSRLSVLAADSPEWKINGKPYVEGVWIEVEPDLWYRGSARGEIASRMAVKREGDKWRWEVQVLTYIGAPHEARGWDFAKSPKGVSKTLEAAQAKAVASIAKDQEFYQRYVDRQRAKLSEALLKEAGSGIWFHASPVRLNVGDALRSAPEPRFILQEPGKVYFTPDPWVAIKHVGGITKIFDGKAFLYRVEPIGDIEDDPEISEVSPGFMGASYMADDAVVTKTYDDLDDLNEILDFPAQPYLKAASGKDLKAAAKAMLEMARRNEPDTTEMMAAEALTHGGQMFGLDYRFKSESSLLRKMEAEAHEFGHDAGMTAANMSDTLRYTMLFPSGNYTQSARAVLDELKQAGYGERVKNYWERGDAYNGLNAAMMTPKGHPFELQFHTPESIDMKERVVHPIYEKWRVESDPKKKAAYAYEMRDAFDTIPMPSGILSIPSLKRQPMPEEDSLKAAALDEGYKYLRLHHLSGGHTTTVIRLDDNGVVEVYKDGAWVEDSHYGRYFFKGEARSDEITPAEAEAIISGLDKTGLKVEAAERWHRHPEGWGYISHDGEFYIERGAPMAGGKSNAWIVHQRTPEDMIEKQDGHPYHKGDGSSLTEVNGTYYHYVGDEGWLEDAKAATDYHRKNSSMVKQADEDQCPYDASDSLMTGGVYTCEDGHQWRPDDPAAQIYHGDGPGRGIIQPQPAKEGSKMDIPDEFGSLFDDAVGSAPLTGGLQPVARAQEWDLDVTSGFATQHEEPEPALPATDGAEDEEAARTAARLAAALQQPPASRIAPSPSVAPGVSREQLQASMDRVRQASYPPPPPMHPRDAAEVQKVAGFPLCAYGCNRTLSASDALVNTTAGLAHANCPGPAPDPVVAAQSNETPEERGRRLLAYVDASMSGQEVAGPNPFEHLMAGQSDNEMKQAAERFLTSDSTARTALKTYDLAERNAIINEGEGVEATNLDRLDISGTHYEAIEAARAKQSAVAEDEDLWMLDGDPNGPDM